MIGRHRYSRDKNPTLLLAGMFVVLLVLVWMFFPRPNPFGRETYVLVSDPMIVASWNLNDRTLTLISIPADIAAEGTHGYGTYSFAAFWRLGEIDKKDGAVLEESVSEALGVPVTGYIGPKTGTFPAGGDALATVKRIFSLKNSIGFIGSRYRTNIPFPHFIDLVWRLNFSRPDRINTYDFTHNTAGIAQEILLPDGSAELLLDPQRVDSQLTTVFENEAVRREAVTVAVYNTTAMPSLGNRVGRMLKNLGISVVTVGNDTPEADTCTVSGSDAAVKSKSAAVIVAALGCARGIGDTSRADLVIRVGKSYTRRFLPN